jgi:hypothetical protein
MAATASVQVSGVVQGMAGGQQALAAAISSAAANGTRTLTVLAAGTNTITIPTLPAPTGCLIILNSANTSIVTFKGVGGDTGFVIGKTGFVVLTWDATAVPASFVLSSVATQTGLTTEVIFF